MRDDSLTPKKAPDLLERQAAQKLYQALCSNTAEKRSHSEDFLHIVPFLEEVTFKNYKLSLSSCASASCCVYTLFANRQQMHSGRKGNLKKILKEWMEGKRHLKTSNGLVFLSKY